MKVLLITDEEWNDAVYGNNVLTNWFCGFAAEFAQIYCSPGMPYNSVCSRYYQITDSQMLRSLFTGQKAGGLLEKPTAKDSIDRSKNNFQRIGVYHWLKKMSLYVHELMMIIRDVIWQLGQYDKDSLKHFVNTFSPDIVFCPRLITPKLMRLEKIVSTMTKAPFVAFTADNESSLNCYSWSPLFWLRRLYINSAFKKHVLLYRHYFTFSEEQAADYHREYGVHTSTLYKCGAFDLGAKKKKVGNPIRIVYAGRLYCNRWKTLAAIGTALEILNDRCEKMVLDIFSPDDLTLKQKKTLMRFKYIRIHAAITPEQLAVEYLNADIALHVESFDRTYRGASRYSFSTKIIDLMSSSCAIMAICWDKHAAYQYLNNKDAAICISSYKEILPKFKEICNNPSLIQVYAYKAWQCGMENHSRVQIQNQIKETFEKVIKE